MHNRAFLGDFWFPLILQKYTIMLIIFCWISEVRASNHPKLDAYFMHEQSVNFMEVEKNTILYSGELRYLPLLKFSIELCWGSTAVLDGVLEMHDHHTWIMKNYVILIVRKHNFKYTSITAIKDLTVCFSDRKRTFAPFLTGPCRGTNTGER